MFSFLTRRFNLSKIGVRPPAPVAHRSGFALACIVKNEARYIGEWARFHIQAGVAHIYVYDDGSTDATAETLKATVPNGQLTIFPWRQRLNDARLQREIHNQVLAYTHAVSNFGGLYRWMSFIDIDEFLIPTQCDNINIALAALEHLPNISLPWHMFGTSGHTSRPEGGVLKNYTQRAANPMSELTGVRAFKCIVDPCRVTAMRVHSIETDGTNSTWNDKGEQFTHASRNAPGFYSTAAIQLNHYYTRSQQDVDEKINRGHNLEAKSTEYKRKVLRTIANIEKETVVDTLAVEQSKRVSLRPFPQQGQTYE